MSSGEWQTTHWYETVMGLTVNPWQACLGGTDHMDLMIRRVEDVGLHCCTSHRCKTVHQGSAAHFLALRLIAETT